MAPEQAAVIVVNINRTEMCLFIEKHHRHHKPPVGYKAAIGASQDGIVVGVGVVSALLSAIGASSRIRCQPRAAHHCAVPGIGR